MDKENNNNASKEKITKLENNRIENKDEKSEKVEKIECVKTELIQRQGETMESQRKKAFFKSLMKKPGILKCLHADINMKRNIKK